MARLVYDTELNLVIEELINDAEKQLVFFCPYFKLHDRLKDCLKMRRDDYKLRIAIIFGKNEDDPSKSLNKDDFEFLKSFPNIIIKYEKRLHAKYYANERNGLITSLNLHTFSQNNNIEAGVFFKTKGLLKNISDSTLGGLTSIVSDTEDIASEAADYFYKVFNNAEVMFENEPQFESKLLGLQKTYTHSKILTDRSNNFLRNGTYNKQTELIEKSNYFNNKSTTQKTGIVYNQQQQGFCIRTANPIPFNLSRPLSRDAYHSWSQFENPDYQEKYCHSCGKAWRTSVRNPICNNCK